MPREEDSGDVRAQISHIKECPEYREVKPYMILKAGPLDIPKSNCFFDDERTILIHDLRGKAEHENFELSGFAYITNFPCATRLSLERLAIGKASTTLVDYLEDTRVFVQGYFRAEKAICFDWRLRAHSDPGSRTSNDQVSLERLDPIPPAFKAHADPSPSGAIETLNAYLNSDELIAFKSNTIRIRIINCWRPLVDLVQGIPLAMCDRRSVQDEDWLLYDRIDESSVGEGHTLHAAFENPVPKRCGPPRASIEVRLMVFTSVCVSELSD